MASKADPNPSNTVNQAGPPHEAQCAPDPGAGGTSTQPGSPNYGPHGEDDRWYRLRLAIFGAAVIAALIGAFAAGFPGWQDYIAQERARRELRAYIVVRPKNIAIVEEGTLPRVQGSFHNIGQTPAKAGGLIAHITVADYPLTEALRNEDCHPQAGKWFVGKVSQPATVRETPFTLSEITAIKEGKAAVYFHGRACYLDIFEESHRTTFCLYWKWDAGRMSPGLYCDQGNSTD